MALPIRVNFENPFIDIHTGRGQGSCTFANGFDCICSCAGIAHAQLLRMVLTPENSKKLPDKYKKALADKIQTVQAHIVDIPHDKATAIIHAQRQPERVFFLCEDITHPIIDYCRVIDIPHWAKENSMTSQQVSRLCACVQRHGIDSFKDLAPKAGEYLSKHTYFATSQLLSHSRSAKPQTQFRMKIRLSMPAKQHSLSHDVTHQDSAHREIDIGKTQSQHANHGRKTMMRKAKNDTLMETPSQVICSPRF